MDKEVDRIIRDIRSLKIQGARNVAKAAIKALLISANKSKAKTVGSFNKELLKVGREIAESRPTEPMTRNIIDESYRFALHQIRLRNARTVSELKRMLSAHEEGVLKKMEDDAKKLALYGARLIPDDSVVLTHCHSSTSTRVMIEAKKLKKNFSVVCFETRPRYQGRVTATELAKAEIDVTLAVDGAMELFMRKADIVIVGADSITSRGDLINKIGTSTLAHIARMNDVSFYSAAELYKYSTMTIFGTREKIEERDPKEVWEQPPKGLATKIKIRNPAFEAVAAKYVNGYITEAGVIPAESLFAVATQKLGIKIYE
ncbi:S-methyl-5-thioribose-1-phosphate isomerase [Candidatus Micrarchaeota archaeon]|nr:S-methyl-5-thioribose-1-phosphate isomerase [Candidatus Micrarchaeota archaeon]